VLLLDHKTDLNFKSVLDEVIKMPCNWHVQEKKKKIKIQKIK